MLCSKCCKKIPEGEEVAKTSGHWRVNGWGRLGNEICCKKCAIKQDKRDRIFIIVIYLYLIIFFGF